MPRRALNLAAAAVASAMLLGGCAAAEPAGDDLDPLADALVVSVFQGRLDAPARRLAVKLDNTAGEALEIRRLTVMSPTLAEPVVRDEPILLAAGDRIDIRLPMPEGACEVDAADAEPVVELEAVVAGSERSVEVQPEDPFEVFRTVNDADCLAVSVARIAALTLPERLEVSGSGADVRAVIEVAVLPAASASGSVEIDAVSSTTLLQSEAGGAWPVGTTVAGGDAPTSLRLDVRPARCDSHAIADDKQGTILPFDVRTSDGREGRLALASGDALKADLYAYYTERCGLS